MLDAPSDTFICPTLVKRLDLAYKRKYAANRDKLGGGQELPLRLPPGSRAVSAAAAAAAAGNVSL